MAERTEILNIEVNYDDAIQKIGNFTNTVNRAKEDQKLFKEELKNGQITQKEYSRSMEESNAVIKVNQQSVASLRKEIQNNIKIENEQIGSLQSLKAQLSNATKAYNEMSREERQGAKGQDMVKHIQSISNELKDAEGNIGLFNRSVGGYQDALASALGSGNAFAVGILRQATAAGTAAGVMGALKGAVMSLGTAMKALLANPIILVLTAVVGIIATLTAAFKKNEEGMSKIQAVVSKVGVVFNALLKALEPIATFLVDGLLWAFDRVSEGLEKTMKGIASALEFLGFDSAAASLREWTDEVSAATKAAGDLLKAQDLIMKLNREQTTLNAEIDASLANITASLNKEGISLSQKIKLLRQEADLNKAKARMQLQLALAVQKAAELEIAANGKTKESLDALAQATAGVVQATSALGAAYQNENKAIEAANKEGVAKAKEAAAKQLAAARSLEDGLLALVKEGNDKQRQIIENSYKRQIEDLKLRLNTEKNLTKKAKEDINALIKNLDEQRNKALNELDEEQVKKNYEIALQNIDNRLAAIKSESAEALALRIDALNKERDMELLAAEKLGTDKALINSKYNKQIADEELNAQKDANNKLLKQQQAAWNNRLLEAELNNKEGVQRQKAILDEELLILSEQLATISRIQGESDEEYKNRQLNLNADIQSIREQQAAITKSQLEAQVTATATMFGALSELASEFADQNEAMAAFSKALALFEIAMNQGKAIAAGIASAMSVPFPGNIAAIATTVAAITSAITSALKIVKGTTTPKATGTESRQGQVSYFSEGGLVTGDGTGTSDSVPAMLSNGEAVMTARTVSLFGSTLSALNQLGNGVPIGTGAQGAGDMALNAMTENAIAKALANQKAPIVQVVDIQRGIRKSEVRDTDRSV